MKRTLGGLLLALVCLVGRGSAQGASTDCTADTQGVYGYNFTMVDETTIANLGLTEMNYGGLNALIDLVNSGDFHILGVPSNVFGLQEPGRNSEILNGIREVRPGNGYVPGNNFVLTSKYDVNGDAEHPLFTYMKGLCPGTNNQIASTSGIYWTPVTQTDITWNFEKFLVNQEGQVVKRYSPDFHPQRIAPDINALLGTSARAAHPKIRGVHVNVNQPVANKP